MIRKALKHVLIAVASLVFGFIAGFIGAVITWPFWDWFEKTTKIESMGHSGPDDWVFYLMISLAAILIFVGLEFGFRDKSAQGDPRRRTENLPG